MNLTALQTKLQYSFNDTELLKLALTHKSYAKTNNERMEFLGDAVLGYVVAKILYAMDDAYNEDDMSLARAHLVRGSTLAEIARELSLGEALRMGTGELKSGGRDRGSILADALEAVIGAVHTDGGITASERLVSMLWTSRLELLGSVDLKDAKTKLQEILQADQRALPVYQVVDVDGADHARSYLVSCTLDDGTHVQAKQSSRRKAEKDAAQLMLKQLGVDDD
ncbi:MAG: ribonuclease-3 [Limisphaerales bacterium]|jgi:ribonuclease-3